MIAHAADGVFDLDALLAMARGWPGLEGMDLAKDGLDRDGLWLGRAASGGWASAMPNLPPSRLREGSGVGSSLHGSAPSSAPEDASIRAPASGRGAPPIAPTSSRSITALKRNILRNLVEGRREGLRRPRHRHRRAGDGASQPDGIFLSNGPGDPAATGDYAVPVIRELLESGKPLFGICLGHQLLGLAVGATTTKMFQGHRGANHPVKRLRTVRSRSHP